MSVKSLPVGTACAVWVGAVGTAILGIVLLGESADVARVAGGVGLKLATPS